MNQNSAAREREKGSRREEMVCLNCQAAFQCAPVLLGIKPSNLLIIDSGKLREACRLLNDTRVKLHVLYGSLKEGKTTEGGKVVIFVYRRELMNQVLESAEKWAFLQNLGYGDRNLPAILRRLQKQYAGYMEKRLPFPHELGILLGYPLADVAGFMEHNGENFLCSGYWKVYANAEEARKTFRLYDTVRKGLSELTRQGMAVADAVHRWEKLCCPEEIRAAG